MNNQKKISVLVVDDSAFMRKVIVDILNSDSEISVVATAKNGSEAIDRVKELDPDVITLDVEMPQLDGINCLPTLLEVGRGNVVMISSLTREGADITIQALELGALEFITKPTNIFSKLGDSQKKEIIDKIKIASKSSRKRKISMAQLSSYLVNSEAMLRLKSRRAELEIKSIRKQREVFKTDGLSNLKGIIAIGISTGGPNALRVLIPMIPADIGAAILIVQHMPPGFTKSLAERLNSVSAIIVKEAEENDILQPGSAYLAPGDFHMILEKADNNNLKIKLTKDPPVDGLRPCVNMMMNSLSQTKVKNVIGVIMTGIGSDGSIGIKNLKSNNNAYIIAQDQESCVVYGMPKEAVKTGVVDAVVSLEEIKDEIINKMEVFK